MAEVLFGTSSFSSRDWIGPFYPPGTHSSDFLRYYAKEFRTVEVDSTYYAIPLAQTVDGWMEKIPDGFIISAKFPKSIVHGGSEARPDPEKLLNPAVVQDDLDRFLNVIGRLGKNLGPLLLQFPYYSKGVFTDSGQFFQKLNRFLADLPKEFRYAVEIRNRHWLTQDFQLICRTYKAAWVLVDHAWMPHGDEVESKFDPITTDFSYIRLIGDRKEIESMTKTWDKEVIDRGDRLQRWSNLIEKISDRCDYIYVYVNNHYSGFAPGAVRKLQSLNQSQ